MDWQAHYDALVRAGAATSTRRAYRRDVAYFWTWARVALGRAPAYPVPEAVVMRFIIAHSGHMPPAVDTALRAAGARRAGGALKVATLRRYLSSLSVAHHEAGVDSPTRSPRVQLLLRRVRRTQAGQAPRQRAALTADRLRALIATCDDSLRGVRDAALLCVGFAAGGRRRAELVQLSMADLARIDGGYLMTVRAGKTDPHGNGHVVPVLGAAAHALTRWLVQSGVREGRVFRGIRNNGALHATIAGRTIDAMVRRRAALAGLGDGRYGAHSLRAGFMTEAARRGTPLGEAMALSGHRTSAVAAGYYRAAAVLANPAACLLDTGPAHEPQRSAHRESSD